MTLPKLKIGYCLQNPMNLIDIFAHSGDYR